MRKIENGGIMYGMLSEIVHFAKPEIYTLLGFNINEQGNVGVNLFGDYDNNIKVTFGIHIDIFCRFFCEMLQFPHEAIEIYMKEKEMPWMSEVFIPIGLKSGIDYFDRYSDIEK